MDKSFKQKFKDLITKSFSPVNNKNYNFDLPNSTAIIPQNNNKMFDEKNIFAEIDKNLEYMSIKYNVLINSDIVIRDFMLEANNKKHKAFIMYVDGLVDSKLINDFILNPLMLKNTANSEYNPDIKFNIINHISDCLLPQLQVKQTQDFSNIISGINAGNCALFVDSCNTCFNIDVKGFKQRSIETPNNEIVIRGSQEAFNEVVRTNTALIRRLVNNENLVIENIQVGNVSHTNCAVCYMKNITNTDLVSEVKYRINNIDIDYLISSGHLEQLIEDNGKFTLPQLIATERPDKCAYALLDGRVVIIVDGSPYALIAPGIFIDFLSSPEDRNIKYQFANLLKFIRILSYFLTLLLPGMYIAITNFHQELIPTELLFTIVASRESVPMPILFEMLIMEISFELIREAGLRIPSAIGSTIGIVGALILGQAAVDASLVSPILIIIVAVTGLASFAIPDFSLAFHCRLLRFGFIILGYMAGFLGIAAGFIIYLLVLCNLKSFGVPYLEPYVPTAGKVYKGIFLNPVWKRESRDDYVKTKRQKKQNDISMKWRDINTNG